MSPPRAWTPGVSSVSGRKTWPPVRLPSCPCTEVTALLSPCRRAIRAAFRNKERGAILTTHYMEEAEAVCDRVAIMVAGKLRCIGSIQQLKSKFGKDYLLEIKVQDSQKPEEIHREVIRLFPHAARQDRFSSLLVYKIPKEDVGTLSHAFFLLEEAKQAYNMEEYSFSQPTLEQVFLELAKEQELEEAEVPRGFHWKQLRAENP
ncbi:hypothetical protein GDO81_024294 [Engystomops pustulosus]|uniref:ABCA1-4-like C-terminal R2 regulatory domain-containing protein n=1 Tax=Engystomops pustulosus TaxID=76066 RepID=A0AAV6ZML7_ENGPU|nr:hypothetical protein GDO81_024294 [Engystomops pustulosus]